MFIHIAIMTLKRWLSCYMGDYINDCINKIINSMVNSIVNITNTEMIVIRLVFQERNT